jgi:methionyl aminopeptidase
VSIESQDQLEALQRVGAVVARTLEVVGKAVRPGVTTGELDGIAAEVFVRHGARSAPWLTYGFPGTICISVNEEAVHGIPGERQLSEGDLVTLDVTAELDGYMADAAVTHAVGEASPAARALRSCARAAFAAALAAARAGVPIRHVGAVVEAEVRRRGFHVLRELCGHGIGRRIHEEPSVPNWADPDAHGVLTEGLVITLEPIVAETTEASRVLRDRFTIVSDDGSLTAHHEHTVVITRRRPLVLTAA